MRIKARSLLAITALVLVLGGTYANHFHNGFQFDDAHTVENNAAIRELRNIPVFFRDATTFSALPSNQSYRPLVSTLLALDYYAAGGLRPFWFHVSIFGLFAALILLLAFVFYQFLERAAPATCNWWLALLAAAAYGLHPANADTVNYIIASADVISTLGVVGSFAVYFAFPAWRRSWLFVLPAAVCILAKPPAAVFALLFAVYRLLFLPDDARQREARLQEDVARRGGSLGHALLARWPQSGLIEIIPPFLICAAVLGFVQFMTPRTWIAGATNAHSYVMTQPYVILLYFKTFFWPADLSVDYDLNPFATTGDPRFWIGIVFTVLFLSVSLATFVFKKTRLLGFGLLWFLIALLPTSLFPLAEVMNDHRTFLPYIGLVLAMAGAVALLVQRFPSRAPFASTSFVVTALLLLGASAYATIQRNRVWKNPETLWRDVTLKSPANGRGLMNYGNTLMAKADYQGALDYFHRARVFAPQYSFLFINLAIAEDATKQTALAEQHFQQALRLAPAMPDVYSFYARFLLAHARGGEAAALLQEAARLSPGDQTVRDLLSEVSAPTAESYLDLSLQHYRAGRFAESIAASKQALALRPDYAEAWNNIGAAHNQLGQFVEGAAACAEALRLKPDFELARNNLAYARTHLSGSTP